MVSQNGVPLGRESFRIVRAPRHGTVEILVASGLRATARYVPAEGYRGGDDFEYMGQANITEGMFRFEIPGFELGERVRAMRPETSDRTFDATASRDRELADRSDAVEARVVDERLVADVPLDQPVVGPFQEGGDVAAAALLASCTANVSTHGHTLSAEDLEHINSDVLSFVGRRQLSVSHGLLSIFNLAVKVLVSPGVLLFVRSNISASIEISTSSSE